MKIAIFGTVGSGKTTISQKLSEILNYEVLSEPVDNNPYLEDYYKDIKATVFKMQIWMLSARTRQIQESLKLDNVIFDRTIIEDSIFMKLNLLLGNINDIDYKTYKDFYENVILANLRETKKLDFDLFIYLKVSSEKSIERINLRNRKAEMCIDNSYWESLNDEYDNFYINNRDKYPFLVIDGNNDNLEDKIKIILDELKTRKR